MTTALETFYHHWPKLVYIVGIVIAALVIDRIVRKASSIFAARQNRIERVWVHAFLDTLGSPLRTLVWILAATIVATLFMHGDEPEMLVRLFPPARNVVVILVLAWYLLVMTLAAQRNMTARARAHGEMLDQTAADAIGKLSRAIICILAALIILQTLGISIGGLLAFGGAAGIAVGFAAQSLVANLLGGLTVYASKIFDIGETIIIPGTKLAGTVERIGWRSTRVLGWDGRPFYVPNSMFNSANLVNHSRLVRREFSERILLRYKDYDKIQSIVRRVNEMLAQRADLNFFSFGFESFGDAALKLHVYAWPQNTPEPSYLPYAEYVRIKQEILMAIADIVIEEGCELIQPFSHVYLRGGEEQHALTGNGMPLPGAPEPPGATGEGLRS